MEIKTGLIDFNQYKTYYRYLKVNNNKKALIILHGGPGSTHNSYELIDSISYISNTNIIMYDQLGCGNSSKANTKEEYNPLVWANQLNSLINYFNLDEVILLGHSWGGMLLMICMCDKLIDTSKVIGCVISSSLSSSKLWEKETHRLLNYLPVDIKSILIKAEKENNFSTKEYLDAYQIYREYYIGPAKTNYECLNRKKVFGIESYNYAWGQNEFAPSGILKDFDYTSKLKLIKCPCLIVSGTDDESTPLINKTIYDNLVCEKEWKLLEKSRHMTYLDSNGIYINIVSDFIKKL